MNTYTSERVILGVRMEMARKKKNEGKQDER